jgi:Methyltransferase domain
MNTSTDTLNSLKRFVPASLKRAAKDALLNREFGKAVRQIGDLPAGIVPNRKILASLQHGWGNEGFAAQTDYLEEVARRAAATAGPILECGSGLTTVLLGLLAGRRGVKTWSLEHHAAWRRRVTETIARFEVPNVEVCFAPLADYDGFEWYRPPIDELPNQFQLVICDGPPGTTAGGRYGLLPVLSGRLPTGSVILLDDAHRSGEAEVIQRWTSEANMRVELSNSCGGSFAVITRN